MPGLNIVFGAANLGPSHPFETDEAVEELYKALEAGGVKKIDTARLYGKSEEWIGKTSGGKRFIIDTKEPGGFGSYEAGTFTRATILEHAKESIARLKVDQVDIFYIHAPDPSISTEELVGGVQDAYKAGLFKRFGLSNFRAEKVEEIYNYAKEHDYVLPSVYQGNYSAVARRQETELFPTLKKLGIAFYAYSPLAGGLLTKTREQLEGGGEAGRFTPGTFGGQLYGGLYKKPAYLQALTLWGEAAELSGVSRAELGYRWVSFHSPLKGEDDSIIFGASSLSQVNQTISWLKAGPLDDAAVAKIDEIWKTIEHEAPLDNYHK